MNVKELKDRVAVLNATISKLNEKRSRNEGTRETLENQKNLAIKAYLDKYGVDLNTVSIEGEFAKLMAEKEKEVLSMGQVIDFINQGDFASAKSILGCSDDVIQNVNAGAQAASLTQSVGEVQQPMVENNSQASPNVISEEKAVNNVNDNSAQSQVTESKVNQPVVASPVMQEPQMLPPISAPKTSLEPASPVLSKPTNIAPSPVLSEPVGVIQPPQFDVSISQPVSSTTQSKTASEVYSGLFGGNEGVKPQPKSLDLGGLGIPADTVNKAVDFSSILSGQEFDPSKL